MSYIADMTHFDGVLAPGVKLPAPARKMVEFLGRIVSAASVAKPGQMILAACTDASVDIPSYCYHPGMSIVASCRICLVEVEGIPKLVPACQTAVRAARW